MDNFPSFARAGTLAIYPDLICLVVAIALLSEVRMGPPTPDVPSFFTWKGHTEQPGLRVQTQKQPCWRRLTQSLGQVQLFLLQFSSPSPWAFLRLVLNQVFLMFARG